MRIEQLEAFVEVASSKSISIAAENLFIAQPSLSKSMKLLEEELAVTLFNRSSDGVRLTAEGQMLLPTVWDILQRLTFLKQQAASLNALSKKMFQDQFKICTMQSVMDCILVFALEEIYQQYPMIEFTVAIPEEQNPYILPDLSGADIFLGLNIGNTFDKAIAASPWEMATVFTDSFSAVVNRRHPLATRKVVTIKDILDYDLVVQNYDFPNAFYHDIIQPEALHKDLNIILRSSNTRVITQMLLSSEAVLVTNNILANNDFAANKDLVIIPQKDFRYHCFCMFPPQTSQQAFIQQFIAVLQKTRIRLAMLAAEK